MRRSRSDGVQARLLDRRELNGMVAGADMGFPFLSLVTGHWSFATIGRWGARGGPSGWRGVAQNAEGRTRSPLAPIAKRGEKRARNLAFLERFLEKAGRRAPK